MIKGSFLFCQTMKYSTFDFFDAIVFMIFAFFVVSYDNKRVSYISAFIRPLILANMFSKETIRPICTMSGVSLNQGKYTFMMSGV